MKQIETLKFKKFCMTIGNLPASYVDSMSYYECLLWLCNYLENTVVPAINNNAEALEELQHLYIQLKEYVDNYFDNLDVQEEINNKIDEMVEDGSLEEILEQILAKSLSDIHLIRTHKINNTSGHNVVITSDDGNTIIDFGFDETGNDIANYLILNGITSFKYAIITHYHGDHVGGSNCEGLLNLLDSAIIDWSNTTFILPPLPDSTRFIGDEIDTITNRYNIIVNKLDSLNIDYITPTENQVLECGDVKLKLMNVDSELWNEYYDVTWVANGSYEGTGTTYNNFSIVTEYTNKNIYALFPSDIELKAQELLYNKIRGNYNIYTAEHHGADDTTYIKYLTKIKPSNYYCVPQMSVVNYYKQTNAFMRVNQIPTLGTATSGNILIKTDGYNCYATSENGEVYNSITENDVNLGLNVTDVSNMLANNDDLNNYTNAGVFRSGSGAMTNSLSNCPLTDTGFKLKVEHTSNNNFIRQTIIPNNGYDTYIRFYYERTASVWEWSTWVKDSNDYLYTSRVKIANNTDLNDITTPGVYVMSADTTYSHTPTTYPGILIVRYINADNRILQEIICNTTKNGIPLSYKRLYGTSGWTSWIEVDNNVFDLNNSIANNTDLNTLTTPGAYYSGSAAVSGTLTNSPVTTTGFRLEVIRISSASSYRQVIYPNNAKSYYVRIKSGSTAEWSTWTTVTIE